MTPVTKKPIPTVACSLPIQREDSLDGRKIKTCFNDCKQKSNIFVYIKEAKILSGVHSSAG